MSWYWLMNKIFLDSEFGDNIFNTSFLQFYPNVPLSWKHLCSNHLTVKNPMFDDRAGI